MNITSRKMTSSVPLIRNKIEDDLATLQKEMNNLVGSFFPKGDSMVQQLFETRFYPSIDVVEKENKYILEADLPGISDSDVSMDFHNNILTIKGDRKSEFTSREENSVCVERSSGIFRRDVSFDEDIDHENIKAELKNGVLHVELTKKERPKESYKKITIKH